MLPLALITYMSLKGNEERAFSMAFEENFGKMFSKLLHFAIGDFTFIKNMLISLK